MIKFSLKLDLSFSQVALIFVGSVACYSIYRCVYSSVRSADDNNINNYISVVEDPLLPKMSENVDEDKPMVEIEENETEAAENYKSETQVARKAPKIYVDNVLEGEVKPTEKTQNTNTEAIRPADDIFKIVELNCSDPKTEQKSTNKEPDFLIEKPMIKIENNKIDAAENYDPETEVASKTAAVNVDNALKDTVKPTKEKSINNTKSLRPADDCFETVDQNFSGSESKQKDSRKELDNLIENSSSNQPILNNIDLPDCFLKNDLYARLTELNDILNYFFESVSDTSWKVESVIEKKNNKDRFLNQTSNEVDNVCVTECKEELNDATKDLFKIFDNLTQ